MTVDNIGYHQPTHWRECRISMAAVPGFEKQIQFQQTTIHCVMLRHGIQALLQSADIRPLQQRLEQSPPNVTMCTSHARVIQMHAMMQIIRWFQAERRWCWIAALAICCGCRHLRRTQKQRAGRSNMENMYTLHDASHEWHCKSHNHYVSAMQ